MFYPSRTQPLRVAGWLRMSSRKTVLHYDDLNPVSCTNIVVQVMEVKSPPVSLEWTVSV